MSIPSFRLTHLRALTVGSFLVASTALLTACAAGSSPAFHTMAGPETRAILDSLHGHIAIAQGDLHCNPLPSLSNPEVARCIPHERRIGFEYQGAVVPEGARSLLMLQVTRGATIEDPVTVALIRNRCAEGRAACSPEQKTIASWTTPDGGNRYRKPMALSPDGRWLATVPASRLLKLDGYSPRLTSGQRFRDSRTVGELVIVELQTGRQHPTGIELLDEQPISWSADGRRLLVVRAETVDQLGARLAAEVQGNEGRGGQGIPVVEVYSIDTGSLEKGSVEKLAIGLDPLWSTDQATLLFKVSDDELVLRDLRTGATRAIALPGMTGRFGPIDFVGPRQVLYWALPTDGTEPGNTGNNSPLVGPKQMVSLKVVDLDTLAFATVYPSIDPRANVGYSPRE